jgi:hypothetical protein
MKDKDYIGKTVQYDFGVPAFSCYTNGKRIKGSGVVTDVDISGGLCVNGFRVFQHEVKIIAPQKQKNIKLHSKR